MLIILILFLLSSCSSKVYVNYPVDSAENSTYFYQVTNWKNAFKNKKCSNQKELSNDDKFPLQSISKLYVLKNCNLSKLEYINLIQNWESDIPIWVKEPFIELALPYSSLYALRKDRVNFLINLSKLKTNRPEREKLILKAQSQAKVIGDSEIIESVKSRLFEHSPRFIENRTKEQFYQIARDYERARDYASARFIYKKIINDEFFDYSVRLKSYSRYAMSYKLERDKKKFRAALYRFKLFLQKELSKSPKNEELLTGYFENEIKRARAIWTNNEADKALWIFKQLLKDEQIPNNFVAKTKRMISGIYFEKKWYKNALEYLKSTTDLEYKDDDLKEEILWLISWTEFIRKNYEESIKYFEKALEQDFGNFFKIKVKFWLGLSYLKMGNETKSKKYLEEVINEDFAGYYYYLTHYILNKKIPHYTTPEKPKLTKNYYFDWLIEVKEFDIAKKYMEYFKKERLTKPEYSNYIYLFNEAKWHDGALFTYFQMPEEEKQEKLKELLYLIYPRPYFDLVSKASQKTKVPIEFIYSIMRQESAYNKDIKSWADAYGLMQLIPEKAKKLAEKINIEFKGFEDLYNPEINILLGAQLLSEVINSFDNNFIFYVASYNAGSGAASNWKKNRFKFLCKDKSNCTRKETFFSNIQFIEEIPYKETQVYVKLVLRNYITYMMLLNQKEFNFPELI